MFPGLLNYWVAMVLMMVGLFTVIANRNMVKKVIGLNIFQVAVFVFYISMSKVQDGSAPILADGIERYSNPLPHVLILTAIVVGVATTAVALALLVRIKESFGTVDEVDLKDQLNRQ
jgi:multicomponent Na+:H+ antiporter subunit C